MKYRKRKLWLLIITILITFITLNACQTQDSNPVKQELLRELTSLAEIENFDGLTFTAYGFCPWIDPYQRFTVESLKSHHLTAQMTLEDCEIEGKLDLFGEIKESDIQLSQIEHPQQARYYMVLESAEDGILLELLLFGGYSTYYVNGVEIKPSDKILEAIKPLLSRKDFLVGIDIYREWDCYCH
ncbi:MAG TPA: hypothetical protein PK459_01355 [Anaerolineaceae bacterium]|jgi:hypothetical protein|nr:hypothetical protein [Anaerolineaceae bacterium]HQC63725.1 hypothetical protein [Anaerolineaceae bacterium]